MKPHGLFGPVLLILTAACSAPAEVPAQDPTVVGSATATIAGADLTEPLPTEDVQPTAEALPGPPLPTPTVRPEMEATDPTTVVLASGQPTLLEFFAFW